MLTNQKHKDIDLLKAYLIKSEPSKSTSLLKFILPPLLVLLVFLSIFAVNKFYVHNVNSEIANLRDEIKTYNNKITVIGDADYNALIKLQEQTQKINDVISTLRTHPKLTSDLMGVFSDNLLSGMSIETITFEDGLINVDLKSNSVLNIETYVRSIRESGNYVNVEYVGYSVQDTTTTLPEMKDDKTTTVSTSSYSFKITCTARGVK